MRQLLEDKAREIWANFKVEITNDGATILKSIGVDNPAAKILVDMSRVQDDEVGDGTTSVTVFGQYTSILVSSFSCVNFLQSKYDKFSG